MTRNRLYSNLMDQLNSLGWLEKLNQIVQSNVNTLMTKDSASLLYDMYHDGHITDHWKALFNERKNPPTLHALKKLGLIYVTHVMNNYTCRLTPLGEQYVRFAFFGKSNQQDDQSNHQQHTTTMSAPTTTVTRTHRSKNQRLCFLLSIIGTFGTAMSTVIGFMEESLLVSIISSLLTILFIVMMGISSKPQEETKTVTSSRPTDNTSTDSTSNSPVLHALDFDNALNHDSNGINGSNVHHFNLNSPDGTTHIAVSLGEHSFININGNNILNVDGTPTGATNKNFERFWNQLKKDRMPITRKDFARFLIDYKVYQGYPVDQFNYRFMAINKVIFPNNYEQYTDNARIMHQTINHQQDEFGQFGQQIEHAMNQMEHQMDQNGDAFDDIMHHMMDGFDDDDSDSDDDFNDFNNFGGF